MGLSGGAGGLLTKRPAVASKALLRVRWRAAWTSHRLFAFITMNWRTKPLVSCLVIIQLIATTTGLTVACQLDANAYEKGIKISDAEMATLNLKPASLHGEWNYTIAPRQPAE